MRAYVLPIVILLAAFGLFYSGARTPDPRPADIPDTEFSFGRAWPDIQRIAARPHTIGSPANAEVRDYLLARMRDLNLNPQVQRATASFSKGNRLSGGTVENIIGVLPGRDREAPAVAIMAHYDSAPGSPGAADDATGVAAALEIVRAIKAEGQPARDLVILLTDGEEFGLLGAVAFFDEHPLAKHIAYVLNMESRGGGGRAAMFQTAAQNGGDIDLLRRTAKHPFSNSLTVFVYNFMPNDTDFTVLKAAGKAGLNYAFIGRQFDYHSPSSTPENLDHGAVQHMGTEVLASARAVAFGDIPERAPDATYSNLVGNLVIAYPAWAGWVFLVLALGLVVAAYLRAQRVESAPVKDVARGAAASVYLLATGIALLTFIRRATGVDPGWMEYRAVTARFELFEVMMLCAGLAAAFASIVFVARGKSRIIAAVLALIPAAGASLLGGLDPVSLGAGGVAALIAISFRSPAHRLASHVGFLAVGLILAIAAQAFAPTAAFFILWPVILGGVIAALPFEVLTARQPASSPRRFIEPVVAGLIAVVAIAWAGDFFEGFLQGLDMPALAALPVWLGAMALWPFAFAREPSVRGYAPAAAFLAASLAIALYTAFVPPWTARHPDSAQPLYIVSPAENKAWRASGVPSNAWTQAFLKAEGAEATTMRLPTFRGDVPVAPTQPVAAPVSDISIEPIDGGARITVRMNPKAVAIALAITSGDGASNVRVNGKPSPLVLKPDQVGRISWGTPETFTVTFRTSDVSKLKVSSAEYFNGWLGSAPPGPMPPTVQAWDLSGGSVVIGSLGPT